MPSLEKIAPCINKLQLFIMERKYQYNVTFVMLCLDTSGSVTLSCLNGSCLFGRRLTLFKTRTLYHRLSRLFMSCDQNNYYVHKLPTLIKFIVLWGSINLSCQASSFIQSLLIGTYSRFTSPLSKGTS